MPRSQCVNQLLYKLSSANTVTLLNWHWRLPSCQAEAVGSEAGPRLLTLQVGRSQQRPHLRPQRPPEELQPPCTDLYASWVGQRPESGESGVPTSWTQVLPYLSTRRRRGNWCVGATGAAFSRGVGQGEQKCHALSRATPYQLSRALIKGFAPHRVGRPNVGVFGPGQHRARRFLVAILLRSQYPEHPKAGDLPVT